MEENKAKKAMKTLMDEELKKLKEKQELEFDCAYLFHCYMPCYTANENLHPF